MQLVWALVPGMKWGLLPTPLTVLAPSGCLILTSDIGHTPLGIWQQGPGLCRHPSLWPQAGCEWSLSGAFSCLFVSSPQCSQQELRGMVIRFLPNTWECGEGRCALFLAGLFYIKIVTFRLLLQTSWRMFRTKPINLGIFGWQEIPSG